ncbi:MAG: histidine phosphatase family protein [Anaerolineales bacterium]|nr:histidine phosphatase family protein [Anaerolineales bacterium]MCS7248533.1 histidine phosphatase family protein [Anaerolineales bacterium]MDW8162346.1 histidine phosphatase family protein [Anaerolineales bacterium]MDW8445999.1 histidine phosphatase family protein [Anaerolineales bacterium]
MEAINYYQIYLLRHGESTGNANGYHQGQYDFPLSEKGTQQARRLASLLKARGLNFDRIISSPLSRARQTAEILAETLSVPLELDPIWMERDAGLLSGLRPEEAQKLYPRPDFISLYEKIGKTGESQWELFLRAGQAIESILRCGPGRYLVVSHGGILNMVMYATLGIFPQPNFYGAQFLFTNTGYAVLHFYPETHNWLLAELVQPILTENAEGQPSS